MASRGAKAHILRRLARTSGACPFEPTRTGPPSAWRRGWPDEPAPEKLRTDHSAGNALNRTRVQSQRYSGNHLCDHLRTTKEESGVARRNRVAGQPRAGRSSCSLCPDGLELRPAVLVFSPSLHCTAEPDLTGRELYGNDSSHGSRITARPRCWSLGPYVALLEVRTLGGGTSLPCSPGRAVARGTISHSNKKGARQGPRLSSFDSSVLLP